MSSVGGLDVATLRWTDAMVDISGNPFRNWRTCGVLYKRVESEPNHRIHYCWRLDGTVEWKLWGGERV